MLRRTQSGQRSGVKGNKPLACPAMTRAAVVLAACLVAACAPSVGGWRSPVKNEASTRADYAQCRERAEQATLTQRQTDRSGYGLESARQTGVFNPRGDNTMAIADRSDTTSLYDKLVAGCMTSKGYRQPNG